MTDTFVASAVAVVADLKTRTLQFCNNYVVGLFGGGGGGCCMSYCSCCIFRGYGISKVQQGGFLTLFTSVEGCNNYPPFFAGVVAGFLVNLLGLLHLQNEALTTLPLTTFPRKPVVAALAEVIASRISGRKRPLPATSVCPLVTRWTQRQNSQRNTE